MWVPAPAPRRGWESPWVPEWAQEKDRVLGPGLVQESVEEKALEWVPVLGPDLEREWAEGSALDEAWLPELSAPAREWPLLWNWPLPCCSRGLERLTPLVDPSETDPAASPAVAVEPLSAGGVPLVVVRPLQQEIRPVCWWPSCFGDCVPTPALPVPPGSRGVGWPEPVRKNQPPDWDCRGRTARCGRATAPQRRATRAPQPEPLDPAVGPPVAPAAHWPADGLRRSRPRRKPVRRLGTAAGNRRPRAGSRCSSCIACQLSRGEALPWAVCCSCPPKPKPA